MGSQREEKPQTHRSEADWYTITQYVWCKTRKMHKMLFVKEKQLKEDLKVTDLLYSSI